MDRINYAGGLVDTFITFPEFKTNAMRRLEWISDLPAGWHAGKGLVFSAKSVIKASQMLRFLAVYKTTNVNVGPEDDGSILLSWTKDSFFFQLSIKEGSGFDLDIEKNDEDFFNEPGLSLDAVKTKIIEIVDEAGNRCTLSERSRSGITTETENLQTLHSSPIPLITV